MVLKFWHNQLLQKVDQASSDFCLDFVPISVTTWNTRLEIFGLKNNNQISILIFVEKSIFYAKITLSKKRLSH